MNFFKTRPKVPGINIAAYLNRLEVPREQPSLSYLRKLCKAHLQHIPIENLDFHFNRPISLEIEKVFEKVIHKRRGGIGPELNSLLYHLLANLGFQCYLTSARLKESNGWSTDFEHAVMILLLDEGLWLVDVGLEDSLIEPKRVQADLSQLDYTRYFKLVQDPDSRWILQQSRDNVRFDPIYIFELNPCELIQFYERIHFHQQSTESRHKEHKLITRLLPDGRVTLTDRELIREINGERLAYPVLNQDAFAAKLEQYFEIRYLDLILK